MNPSAYRQLGLDPGIRDLDLTLMSGSNPVFRLYTLGGHSRYGQERHGEFRAPNSSYGGSFGGARSGGDRREVGNSIIFITQLFRPTGWRDMCPEGLSGIRARSVQNDKTDVDLTIPMRYQPVR